ncbi:MAG TPA: glutamate racemase [bacterium]|nr:glutamate racemase [bacterium]
MIGVFDSGVGGLTVLRHFLLDYPNYNYIYLGDTANVPYGNKSPETIYGHTTKAIDFLYAQGCRLIIIACNTSSAQALRRIQQEAKYPDLRVLGVIRPIAEKVALLKNVKRVGIIGTRATINSNIYFDEIKALKDDIEIFQKATPLLVPLVEEAWFKRPETRMILKKYLLELKVKQVQVLVLACTHYPFLLKDIKRIMGKKCLVFDPGKVVSDSLGDYLKRHTDIKLSKGKKDNCCYYVTDNVEKFKELGEMFLKKKLDNVKKVDLN